jgi:pyruvate kinase
MTRIISTVGPISSNKNLKFVVENSGIIRLNMSHNTSAWHKKNINFIKKLDPNKYILVDIPGAKPRTLNNSAVNIKKDEKIIFKFNIKKKIKSLIPISNPLPRLSKNKIKYFSVSDGNFLFKFVSLKKNELVGISCQSFILYPRKGLNVPFSIYDNKYQSKIYINFIKKISNLKFDCIGLSFVQDSKIIDILKNFYKNKIFISKIENYLGYKNRKDIIRASDAIMVDRGDLAAEVGNENLTDYVDEIIKDCKFYAKPIIIATENLNSLINSSTPSKSDILNLDYYISKKVDFIMLSDESATSKYWKNTIFWLKKYLQSKKKIPNSIKTIDIQEILKKVDNQVLVVFSKKGYFLENLRGVNYSKLILFTENKDLSKSSNLKENINSFYIKFPKKNIDNFLFKNIKNKKKIIFKYNETAALLNVTFPRKKSRINTLIVISKKDFKNR